MLNRAKSQSLIGKAGTPTRWFSSFKQEQPVLFRSLVRGDVEAGADGADDLAELIAQRRRRQLRVCA
jgi:hypothetical protein